MKSRTSSRHSRLLAGVLGAVLALMPLVDAQAQDPTRFESEIQAFESADRAVKPPADPVLFTGSSSVRMWTNVAAVFPDYPVMNRGFGGSHMSDLLHYFDRVVAVYKPALIVVYEGDNDLSGGKSVDQVYADYVAFVAKVKQRLPASDVAFLAVKPSPSRAAHLEATRQLNTRLEALAAVDSRLWFIDVFTPMLDNAGQPRPELFGSDMLHMNAAGYALWKPLVAAMLREWSATQGQSFLFDFGAADTPTKNGPAPDDPNNFWNNVTEAIGGSATGNLRGVVNTRGKSTAVVLRMVSPFNGGEPNRRGVAYTGPVGFGVVVSARFALNATKDSLYSTGTSNDSPEMFASFKLGGLSRKRVYHFTFYAAHTGMTDSWRGEPASLEATYTVVGENQASVTYDPANNIDDRVGVVVGIVPDAVGEITISLAPTTRNNRYSINLGVMQVDETAPPKPILFVQEPADQTVEEFRPAHFHATVQGTPPYVVQWLMNGLPIPDANEFAYTIKEATLDLDGALFSVSVSNALYSAASREAVLHVVPDVNAPVLLAVESTDGLTARLLFDERLDPNTALAAGNYRVNAGNIEVVGVELDADGRTVTLLLESRLTSLFDVSVSGVRDLAGNEIAPDTRVKGEVRPQAILIDFGASGTPMKHGPAPDDPDNFWNNVTDGIGATAGARVQNLVTVMNDPTGVALVIVRRFNGANTNGTLGSMLFPQDATRDSLFGNTETFSGLTNVFPSFKLTGLDPLQAYDFTFYASRMGVSDNRETGYAVEGTTSGFAALNAAGNVNKSVQVIGIEPTAAGEITISLAPTIVNNNANHFTYLGAMRLEPTPIDGQR
jgi:lysophospholipase L1-like esterase